LRKYHSSDEEDDGNEMEPLDVSIKQKYTLSTNSSSGHQQHPTMTARRKLTLVVTTCAVVVLAGGGISVMRRHPSANKSSRRGWGAPVFLRENTALAETIIFSFSGRASFQDAREFLDLELVLPSDADYGGLEFVSVAPNSFQRELQRHDDRALNWYREDLHELFFADEEEEVMWGYADALVDPTKVCIWPAQIARQIPICNPFHELSFDRPNEYSEIKFLGSGYYRDTWFIQQSTHTDTEELVLKHQRYDILHNRNRLQKVQTEAFIMGQLADSDRVSDIYGHCAFSLWVEAGLYDMKASVLPLTEYQGVFGKISQEALDELSVADAHPMNNFTVEEKLRILLDMTQSLAETHGLPTGPAVMQDIAADQWLRASDGNRVILNDFDNAVFLSWNFITKQHCQYYSGYVGGFKAPEEHNGNWLDESTDLWKVGSLIFAVLTGLKPYYTKTSEDDKWALLDAGVPPYLDPRYETRSLIEGRLVEIMRKCHQFHPADRVDIFEVVAFLRETKRLHEQERRLTLQQVDA
jgi:serine/threonine protein kinase